MHIAFYSNVRGIGGATSNLSCIGSYLAMQYSKRILMWENHLHINNIASNFERRNWQDRICEEQYKYLPTGMNTLLSHYQANLTCDHMIEQATKSFWSDQLLYLPIVQEKEEIFEKDLCQVLNPLLEGVNEVGDIVLIDTADIRKESTQRILEQSDIIVVNLAQDMKVIEDYFKSPRLRSKTIFLIGNYHENSRINLKNISRKFHINQNQIAVIPNNVQFQEALSFGKVTEFMIQNRECQSRDYNYSFMREVKKAASMILYTVDKIQEGRCEDCFV